MPGHTHNTYLTETITWPIWNRSPDRTMYSPRNQAKYYSPWGDIYYPPTSTGVIVTRNNTRFTCQRTWLKHLIMTMICENPFTSRKEHSVIITKKYTGEEVIITKLVACRTISCSEHPRLIWIWPRLPRSTMTNPPLAGFSVYYRRNVSARPRQSPKAVTPWLI